jgi:hypothetical protein
MYHVCFTLIISCHSMVIQSLNQHAHLFQFKVIRYLCQDDCCRILMCATVSSYGPYELKFSHILVMNCTKGISPLMLVSWIMQEIKCYVCKQNDHLCCADFSDNYPNELTCYNCAQSGHTGLVSSNVEKSISPTICLLVLVAGD